MRKIAPFLQSKAEDPAVLVSSLDLKKIIPLLSGHLGGANELAEEIVSKIDGAVSFTTTATDQTETFAFDMFAKKNGLKISNLDKLAKISNTLINKEKVSVVTYKEIFNKLKSQNLEFIDIEKEVETLNPKVYITPCNITNELLLKPKVYLGMGMNRGTALEEIEEAFIAFLENNNLAVDDIEAVGSFEAKKDEKGFLEFIEKYQLQSSFFTEDNINGIEKNFSDSKAQEFFNIKGVAEPSAYLLSKYKILFAKKQVFNQKVTIAGAV